MRSDRSRFPRWEGSGPRAGQPPPWAARGREETPGLSVLGSVPRPLWNRQQKSEDLGPGVSLRAQGDGAGLRGAVSSGLWSMLHPARLIASPTGGQRACPRGDGRLLPGCKSTHSLLPPEPPLQEK